MRRGNEMDRRQLLRAGALLAGGVAMPELAAAATRDDAARGERPFVFAVIADSHVIDQYYVPGSENGVEDNESILRANDRLRTVRETIRAVRLKDGRRVEHVFLVGDGFHNYPSADMAFYDTHETRIDHLRQALDAFEVPVHLGFGNHDYDVPRVPREMSHELFKAKLKAEPYMSVDVGGIRFVHLNNFLGATWDAKAPEFNKGMGSLGETQLQWAEAQLATRKPTVVFIHYPLWIVQPTEVRDFGTHPLLRKYQDSIQMVIAGHWHKWVDFARTFGPQHYVSAATRYDDKAFMLFEADGRKGTVRWLDQSRPEWSTHYSAAYREGLA